MVVLRCPFVVLPRFVFFFFFNDTATTEIYTFPYTTLFRSPAPMTSTYSACAMAARATACAPTDSGSDRKSTRLNSSHQIISYAVFCLKKKKEGRDASRNRSEATSGQTTT